MEKEKRELRIKWKTIIERETGKEKERRALVLDKGKSEEDRGGIWVEAIRLDDRRPFTSRNPNKYMALQNRN